MPYRHDVYELHPNRSHGILIVFFISYFRLSSSSARPITSVKKYDCHKNDKCY